MLSPTKTKDLGTVEKIILTILKIFGLWKKKQKNTLS